MASKIIGLIKADKCFDIFINTDNLVVGSDYNISFLNGKWSYCARGENTVCVNTVIGDLVVGIGAYDPNEFNDKSDYIYYTVEVLNNYNGFSFRLLDRELKYLKFCVATAKIEQYPSIVYEDAVGYWLT